MSYDPKKDKTLKEWRITVTDTKTAVVSLKCYDSGAPRLQIGPMEIEKENGEVIHARIKRWGWDELHELRDAINQAIDLIDDLEARRPTGLT